MEWKVIYVGSAESQEHDQILEEVMVGPVPVGVNTFVLQAPAANHEAIPHDDILGVTVVLLTCSYLDEKFLQIGYYVNNEYSEPFEPENPPNPVDINKVFRNILADQPRVTRFPINWNGAALAMDPDPLDTQCLENNNNMLGDVIIVNDDSMDVEQMRGVNSVHS